VTAFSRPFWPLFLHVFGAMVLVGAVLSVLILSLAARRTNLAALRKAALRTLLIVAIPAYVVFRIAAQVIYDREKDIYNGNDPTWVGIGFIVADLGLLILLITAGLAFWWNRSGKPGVGLVVSGLSAIYLAMLTVAMLAMSGKWN
jgi:prolipoprotein diacylglyceryltransferase